MFGPHSCQHMSPTLPCEGPVCSVRLKVHLCEHALRDVQGTGLCPCCLLRASHDVGMRGRGMDSVLKEASR